MCPLRSYFNVMLQFGTTRSFWGLWAQGHSPVASNTNKSMKDASNYIVLIISILVILLAGIRLFRRTFSENDATLDFSTSRRKSRSGLSETRPR